MNALVLLEQAEAGTFTVPPGHLLVVRCAEPVTAREADHMTEALQAAFRKARSRPPTVVVVPPGCDFAAEGLIAKHFTERDVDWLRSLHDSTPGEEVQAWMLSLAERIESLLRREEPCSDST